MLQPVSLSLTFDLLSMSIRHKRLMRLREHAFGGELRTNDFRWMICIEPLNLQSAFLPVKMYDGFLYHDVFFEQNCRCR
jgi:hypothetical protein